MTKRRKKRSAGANLLILSGLAVLVCLMCVGGQLPDLVQSLPTPVWLCSAFVIVVLFLLVFSLVKLGERRDIRRRFRASQDAHKRRLRALRLADIDNMSGIEFEHYVSKLLVYRGFEDVGVTPSTGDFGVDIVASKDDKKYAIQVKRHSGHVSRRAVSEALGGIRMYQCNAAMVVTNSLFTTLARDFAKKSNCELVDRHTLSTWILEFQSQTELDTQSTIGVAIELQHDKESHNRLGVCNKIKLKALWIWVENVSVTSWWILICVLVAIELIGIGLVVLLYCASL